MDTQEIRDRERMGATNLIVKLFKSLSSLLAQIVTVVVDWFAQLIHKSPIGRYISLDVLRYAICGGANYIIFDAILYFVTFHYLVGEYTYINIGIATISPHILSMIVVFPVTLLVGFWLNRHVVFDSTELGMRRQLGRYLLSIAGSIALSYLILKGLVEGLAIWPTVAKIISSMLTATYSYLIARLYTFKKNRAEN